jgi:hypothetical protein
VNKYLRLIKSEKQPQGGGSKGSKAPCGPFEPEARGRFEKTHRDDSRLADPSEPFEPARGDRSPKTHGSIPGDCALPPDCVGALRDPDGALYLPWGPYINREQLSAMQRELFEVVDELAKLERWPDADYDHVVMCVERQPISTLRPDLAHFTERLRVARAEDTARLVASRRAWKYDR